MSIFPDEPSQEEAMEQLPEDNETPFRPADDVPSGVPATDLDAPDRTEPAGGLDDTHQVTDTNLDPHEIYDEGYSGAAEASEPNAGDAVVGYDPEKDQRRAADGAANQE
jgi:hypothetical protein